MWQTCSKKQILGTSGSITFGSCYAGEVFTKWLRNQTLRLNRSSPWFCLMGNGSHTIKIKIDTAILRVRNIQLLPDISNELNQTITHHNAYFQLEELKSKVLQSVSAPKIEDQSYSKAYFVGLVTNRGVYLMGLWILTLSFSSIPMSVK